MTSERLKTLEKRICLGIILFSFLFVSFQLGRYYERQDIKSTFMARRNPTFHYTVPQIGLHVFPFNNGFIQFDGAKQPAKDIARGDSQ